MGRSMEKILMLPDEIGRKEDPGEVIVGLPCGKCKSTSYLQVTVIIETVLAKYKIPEVECISCHKRYIFGKIKIEEKGENVRNVETQQSEPEESP